MDQTLRKTLFISSYAPPAISGGGQNLYHLIKDLPADAYFIMTSFYNLDNVSAKLGQWLPAEYIFYDNPRVTKENFQTQAARETIKKNFASKLKQAVKKVGWARILAGPYVIAGQISAAIRQGLKTMKEKNIELLLGFSDYGPATISTYLLHKITKRPFFFFLFDIYKGNFFPFPGGFLAKIFEPKLFKEAEKIIVTNEGTKEFYRQRYGDELAQKIVVIHNSIDPEPYLALQTPYEPKEPYTILFTGNIYWPQIGSLKNLMRAVDEINDLKIQLKIYAPQTAQHLRSLGFTSPKITFDVAPPSEMSTIQSQADILFLPLSWHTKSPSIINTATPGKLTDYLIAGRPMLIHAPASTYVAKYAKDNNFALVVDEENIEQLKAAIKKLLLDVNFSQQLIANAREVFFQNHNANKNSKKFESLLTS
jgi:glycosyltransferase involved in cell wall biosynthesis